MADESPRRHYVSYLWIRTFWRGWVIFQMKKTTDLELRITTKNRKYSISSEPKEFICPNLSLKVLMKTTAVVVVHSTTEPIYLIENERSHSHYYANKQMQKMQRRRNFFQNTKQQITLYLMIRSRKLCELNRPFSGCPKPLFESEANWEAIGMEMIFYSCAKQKSFSQERFCAQPLFESESFWIQETAYSKDPCTSP